MGRLALDRLWRAGGGRRVGGTRVGAIGTVAVPMLQPLSGPRCWSCHMRTSAAACAVGRTIRSLVCIRRGIVVGHLLLLVFLGGHLAAASTNDFLARTYSPTGRPTLPYRLLVPSHYDPKNRYPLILYLHGAAARGNDNAEPLNWGPQLLGAAERGDREFFLVVPQCPRNGGWLEASFGVGPLRESEALKLTLELVEKTLPKEFNIDATRRYLTGVSMGGHAVWVLMVRHPGFFAAAIPVCAGGSAGIVTGAAAKFPVWAFHSDDDHLVPVQQARDLVKAWRDHGGTAQYTEYTGWRHSSWKKAYVEPELFDWLFRQHLP